jgi:hypothetical protein
MISSQAGSPDMREEAATASVASRVPRSLLIAESFGEHVGELFPAYLQP